MFGLRRFVTPRVFGIAKRFASDARGFEQLHPTLMKRAQILSVDLTNLQEKMSAGEVLSVSQQKQYSQMSAIVEVFKDYLTELISYKELEGLLADESLAEDAQQEIDALLPQLIKTTEKLKERLLPQHEFADKPCMLELRPGVGGTEAMIFTEDLLNMYIGYANFHGWKHTIVSKTTNTSGNGILEAILTIDEPGSYNNLRFEAGVHRVQRIPETDTKGRIQTSTAGVVVLPQMGESKEEGADEKVFQPGEVRIDIMRSSGKGGQHVNTTDSAVRLTHIPTGITVSMQDERSQHKNKAKAYQILRARIAEKERLEKEAKERKARTDQVSSTDRSDKIRTYNYVQNRVTDHRCGFTMHNLDSVLLGEKLDDLIDAMAKFDSDLKAKRLLAELEEES